MCVLGWWEMAEEDQPPMERWGVDSELSSWFEMVKARRKDPTSVDTESDMTQNEASRELLR